MQETDDVDLLAPDISPDHRFRHAWRLTFTGTVIAYELVSAIRAFVSTSDRNMLTFEMMHEVYDDPQWPLKTISQLRKPRGGEVRHSSPECLGADNVWGSRLFGGDLCAFHTPNPPDPNLLPIIDWDPRAPPKKRSRVRVRPPTPEPPSLQEQYLEYLKALQAIPDATVVSSILVACQF